MIRRFNFDASVYNMLYVYVCVIFLINVIYFAF